MSELGRRLRSAREDLNRSRVDVAKATKVGAHHLAALEFGDFEALPDDVYVRGFVRTYAEYLGLDADAALDDLGRELETRRDRPGGDVRDAVVRKMSETLVGSRRASRRRLRGALLGGAALVAVSLAWLGLSRLGGGREPGPAVPAAPAQASAAAAPDESAAIGAGRQQAASAEQDAPTGQPEEIALGPALEPPAAVEPAAATPSPPELAPAARRPPEPPAAAPGAPSLSVVEHGVGRGVEHRRLVGESERFPEGREVWYWTRVRGGHEGDTIRHVWIHEGREAASIELTLGGQHWRTYSRKRLSPGSTGAWVVEARDATGNVLSRREFLCTR